MRAGVLASMHLNLSKGWPKKHICIIEFTVRFLCLGKPAHIFEDLTTQMDTVSWSVQRRCYYTVCLRGYFNHASGKRWIGKPE